MTAVNSPSHNALGDDYISPSEIRIAFKKICYSPRQFLHFVNTLPSEEILAWGQDNNCLLVPGPPHPLSILGIRNLKRGNFQEQYGGLHFRQNFAEHETVGPKWIMLRKELITESLNKSHEDHLAMVPAGERIVSAVEIAWCLAVYKAARDSFLLQDTYTRTSSAASSSYGYGNRDVVIGRHWSKGMDVNSVAWSERHSMVGLLTARNL